MTSTTNSDLSVQSIFWPTHHRRVKEALLVLLGALFLAAASQLSIPLTPVPLTFQSATVALIGMVFGMRLGLATICAYLIAGTLGLPVFADFSAGTHALFSMSGGYLLGFVPAVAFGGFLAERGWVCGYLTAFGVALLSVSIIFLIGATQLSLFIGWHAAWVAGVKPFIATEILKLLVVALAAKQVWRKG